jgi:hypothetical protein
VVAPAEVHRRHAAAGLGLVDHVVVVERSDLHQLDRHTTLDDVVGGVVAPREGGGYGQDRAEALATCGDEVLGDLGEVIVRRADSLP